MRVLHNPPHPGYTLRDGAARLWLAEQASYDLWHAAKKAKAAKTLRIRRAPEAVALG
jgi:plasmid maintenance system antidote protein VapI